MFAIIKRANKEIMAGPRNWQRKFFQSQLKTLAGANVSLPANGAAVILEDYAVLPVTEVHPVGYNSQKHDLGGPVNDVGEASITSTFTMSEKSLTPKKERMTAEINARAETLRADIITMGSGQALEYESIRAEITRYNNDGSPDPSKYPFLMAGVGSDVQDTGDPLEDLAAAVALIVETMTAWNSEGAAIRQERLSKKAAVAAAATYEELEAIEI